MKEILREKGSVTVMFLGLGGHIELTLDKDDKLTDQNSWAENVSLSGDAVSKSRSRGMAIGSVASNYSPSGTKTPELTTQKMVAVNGGRSRPRSRKSTNQVNHCHAKKNGRMPKHATVKYGQYWP